MSRKTLFTLGVFICWAVITQTAQAQACEGGRVTVDGGYCCWPGQQVAEDTGRCVGPPRCSRGLVASGSECVAAAVSPASATPVRAREADTGLIIAGAVLLGIGYFTPAIASTVVGQEYSCCGIFTAPVAPNWGFGWLPLVHSLSALDAQSGFETPLMSFGLAGAAFEIGGVVLLVLGIVGHERSPGMSMGPGQLTLGGGAGGGSFAYSLAF